MCCSELFSVVCFMLDVGCWFLAVGYWPLVAGGCLLLLVLVVRIVI